MSASRRHIYPNGVVKREWADGDIWWYTNGGDTRILAYCWELKEYYIMTKDYDYMGMPKSQAILILARHGIELELE